MYPHLPNYSHCIPIFQIIHIVSPSSKLFTLYSNIFIIIHIVSPFNSVMGISCLFLLFHSTRMRRQKSMKGKSQLALLNNCPVSFDISLLWKQFTKLCLCMLIVYTFTAIFNHCLSYIGSCFSPSWFKAPAGKQWLLASNFKLLILIYLHPHL